MSMFLPTVLTHLQDRNGSRKTLIGMSNKAECFICSLLETLAMNIDAKDQITHGHTGVFSATPLLGETR